jgi:hypothetical protein
MKKFARTLTLAFSAGALGGLVNSLSVWLAVKYGLTAALGVSLSVPMSPAWIYPRIVWGGI